MVELLPLVGSWADIEFPRIQAQLGTRPEPPPAIRFADFLSFVWVTPTDGGLSAASVVSFESDPLDVAMGAVATHRPPRFERIGPGTFQSCTRDGFDSSRLLLVDDIRALGVRGDPVAAVPNRDTLVVTGLDDLDGLRQVGAVAWSAFESPRPISARPVVLRGRRWEPLRLPRGHALYTPFSESTSRELHALYQAQRELLMRLFEAKGDETYVTPFDVGKDAAGNFVTHCTWTGVVSDGEVSSSLLLPLTDKIQIIQVRGTTPQRVVGLADREAVLAVCKGILEPLEYEPPRLRTLSFPTPEMIAQLARLAPP